MPKQGVSECPLGALPGQLAAYFISQAFLSFSFSTALDMSFKMHGHALLPQGRKVGFSPISPSNRNEEFQSSFLSFFLS